MKVTFKKSNVTAEWDDRYETLLEFGEAHGIDLDFGCRMGNCTTCQQPLISGDIEYPEGHNGEPEEGNILLCSSVPKTDVVIDA